MKLEHQIIDDSTFKHRLVPKGTALNDTRYPWVGYRTPADYHTTKGVFIAVTEYYKGSIEFPNPKKVYWIQEAPEDI
jgi:hypothetical protein